MKRKALYQTGPSSSGAGLHTRWAGKSEEQQGTRQLPRAIRRVASRNPRRIPRTTTFLGPRWKILTFPTRLLFAKGLRTPRREPPPLPEAGSHVHTRSRQKTAPLFQASPQGAKSRTARSRALPPAQSTMAARRYGRLLLSLAFCIGYLLYFYFLFFVPFWER